LAARLIAVLGMILSFAVLAPAAQATFPGKNGRIVFSGVVSPPGPVRNQLWAIAPDGTGLTNLSNSASNDYEPAVSADGRKIAFTRNDDLWVMNFDGSGQTRLTFGRQTPIFCCSNEVSWSPDGNKIAFASGELSPGNYDIYVIHADGTGLTRLTTDPAFDDAPAWSPDGGEIAFTRGEQDVYVMNSDGTGQTNLTTDTGSAASSPNWSPDGSKLVFTLNDQLYTMYSDGTGKTPLFSTPTTEFTTPVWSPDATQIAYTHLVGHGSGASLRAVNSDGTGERIIFHADALNGIDWQPTSEPRRSDFKNANQFCKAEQAFWGNQFSQHYRNFGQCVSGK
jgi:TolB protein